MNNNRTSYRIHALRSELLESLEKDISKIAVQFIGGISWKLIIEKGNERHLEIVKEIATLTKSDVLQYVHEVKGNKKIYQSIYRTGYFNIAKENIHQMTTFFIDIDKGLYDESSDGELNYYKVKRVLKELYNMGIRNYETWLSASGNIHLYINTRAITDKEYYQRLQEALHNVFKVAGLEVDKTVKDIVQGVWLEGFRVLSKGGCSRRIEELSNNGHKANTTYLRRFLNVQGLKVSTNYKRCMYVMVDELRLKDCSSFSISELAFRYGLERSTLSRALQILKDSKALNYTITAGANGGIEVLSYDMKRIVQVIELQMTRKQNYIFQKVRDILQVFSWFMKLCEYIKDWREKKAFGYSTGVGFRVKLCDELPQGCFEGCDYEKWERLRYPLGERYRRLIGLLVYKWRSGVEQCELENIAMQVYKNMEQKAGNEFTEVEVKRVLRWVLGIDRNVKYTVV